MLPKSAWPLFEPLRFPQRGRDPFYLFQGVSLSKQHLVTAAGTHLAPPKAPCTFLDLAWLLADEQTDGMRNASFDPTCLYHLKSMTITFGHLATHKMSEACLEEFVALVLCLQANGPQVYNGIRNHPICCCVDVFIQFMRIVDQPLLPAWTRGMCQPVKPQSIKIPKVSQVFRASLLYTCNWVPQCCFNAIRLGQQNATC